MKKIILFILTAVASVVLIACSTEWEELKVNNEQISYNDGELPCKISVGVDQATISFDKPRSGVIFLNGKFLAEFKDLYHYIIWNLTPNEKYTIQVNCMDGNNALSKTLEITTNVPFVTQIGWYELDPYNYEEKQLGHIFSYPKGGFVDDTYKSVRRLDADGNVMWRTELWVSELMVSDEGGIATLSYGGYYNQNPYSNGYATRIEPETGKVLYECHPTNKEIVVNGIYPCSNGGMVLVGHKRILHYDNSPVELYYYFGLFDANGKAVHEELGREATSLYKVIEKTGGGFIAMGQKGAQTIVLITFDANGKKVSSDSEYLQYRDLNYWFNIRDVKKDKDGSVYFFIDEQIIRLYCYFHALVVKVNPDGKIVWTRPLAMDGGSVVAYTMYILENNRLCVVFGENHGLQYNTVIVTMTKDNEILRGDNLGISIPPMVMFPLNKECTEFKFYESYGQILHVNLNSPHDEEPFKLKEGV